MSQKERPYGLSKVVTLAVLPRLYMEELTLELGRRNIAAQNSADRQDLINTLADVIMREFCGLSSESSESVSREEEITSQRIEADSRFCEMSAVSSEVSPRKTPTLVPSAATVSAVHKRKRRENETATSSSITMTPPRPSNLEEPSSKRKQTGKKHISTVTSTEETTQAKSPRNISRIIDESESPQSGNSPSSDIVLVKVEPAWDRENERESTWRDSGQVADVAQDQADVGSMMRTGEFVGVCGGSANSGDVVGVYGVSANSGDVVSEWCVEQNVVVDSGVSLDMDQGLLNQQPEGETPEASCSTGKLHRCPHCYYTTTWSSVMTRHLRTHTGEKPFKCPHCEYSASQKGTLDRHIATHSGERPFVCVECGYAAVDKSRLARHLKTHSLNKVYVCEVCGFSTTDKLLAMAHEATHTTHPPDNPGDPPDNPGNPHENPQWVEDSAL